MPRTIEKTIYRITELEGRARERALYHLRESVEPYYDFILDRAKEDLRGAGLQVNHILFSGFWSQGDGACFEGSWSPANMLKGFSTEAGAPYHHGAEALRRIVANLPAGCEVSAIISHRGRHYHDRSMCVDVTLDWSGEGDDPEDGPDIDSLNEDLRDAFGWLACDIYRQLESEYEYQTSEEALTDAAEANEYEFDENGGLV